MTDAARAVSVLRRRLALALFARYSLVWVAVSSVVAGLTLLLAKQWHVSPPLWPVALAFVPALVVASAQTLAKLPSRAATVALLDAQSHSGGMLMASEAVNPGAWSAAVAAVPRVRWRGSRQSILTAACVAFVIAAAIVPARSRSTRQTLAIQDDLRRLEQRVELLKNEEVLPDERAEAMTATLEELARDASGDDPAKAWETLDAIDEATLRAAAEAAAEAVRKAEALTVTEAAALALTEGGLDPSEVAAAMNEAETLAAIGGAALTEEQLRQLGASARQEKEQLRARLEKLRDAALIDPSTLRAFEKSARAGNREELARFLAEAKGQGKVSEAVSTWIQPKGRPGVSRGRGDAPMLLGAESEGGGTFDEHALPAASVAALAQSELIATSAAAPTDATGMRSAPGALRNVRAGGGSALTPVVQPRHRGTVQRYFERKAE